MKDPEFIAAHRAGLSIMGIPYRYQMDVFVNASQIGEVAESVLVNMVDNSHSFELHFSDEVLSALKDKRLLDDYKSNNIIKN